MGASGRHGLRRPRQNNAAAAEAGPAEGNSLLPGCLRWGTLKQWKFPSSKGEQKERCWEPPLKRDRPSKPAGCQTWTASSRACGRRGGSPAWQKTTLLCRTQPPGKHRLTTAPFLRGQEFHCPPLACGVESTAAAEGAAQPRGVLGLGRAPHAPVGHETPRYPTDRTRALREPFPLVFAGIWKSPDFLPWLKGVAAEEISLQSLQIPYCRCHTSAAGGSARPGRGEGCAAPRRALLWDPRIPPSSGSNSARTLHLERKLAEQSIYARLKYLLKIPRTHTYPSLKKIKIRLVILQLTFLSSRVLKQREKLYWFTNSLKRQEKKQWLTKYFHWLPWLLDQAQKNAGISGETLYFLTF